MAAAAASELTAEQVVDLGAQLAADMVFAKGITRAVQKDLLQQTKIIEQWSPF